MTTNDDILSEATGGPVGHDSLDPTEGTAHGDSEPSAATEELVAESTTANSPQQMDQLDVTDRSAMRCPETGRFLKGWKGGGRKKGSKDRLNMQVIDTMERLWAQRGDEIMEHLAAEKPEVLAGLVARLIPQSLAAEAITGEDQKGESNQEVTIKVVTQQHQDVLPPREVEGELLPLDNTTH